MLKSIFGQGKNFSVDQNEIVKEGALLKESRHLKNWRERWTVLSDKHLLTFEKEKVYNSPTEIIDVCTIKTVKSDDNPLSFVFRIETTNGNFYFQAKSFDEKESWIGSIGKVMIQGSRKNIFINEEED